ncbi:TolC family outer membrane protein [Sulfurimonas sp. SAG-AH-194-I05]|nr:TolC family outer membrane protein [Sulfurimonas sp. SAG-AH-194-I05]MDF1874827.1 TolC family outer membrane protein [Sulfurimonas sp. SAG-AH-194-I05]
MKNLLILALTFPIFSHAQDLKSTIQEILSTNPIVLERLKNYNATKEDIRSAKAGYYPKIDLSIGVGQEITNKDNGVTSSFDFTVYQNSLTYTQNLFKGFETTYQIKQQEYKKLSASHSYIEKVNDISFQIVNSYLELMKNTELLKNAQENVQINEDIFTKVKKLYDSGLTTLSEVNKIESSLSLAKSNYVVQENTLLDINYNLKRVLGRFLNPQTMTRPVFITSLPQTIEEAAQYAIQNNPSILVSHNNIKAAQASYKEKKSPFYPQVDIEITQSMNKNVSAVRGKEDKLKAMAFVKYNLFNGFADTSALQKSVSKIHQEVQNKSNLRRQVLEGLELSWASNEKLTLQLGHLENYKEFSLKTLTLYSKEYDLGRRSLLDLLSAQNDFIGSKSQIITTKYNILFAKYRILDAMGILVTSILDEEEVINFRTQVGLVTNAYENSDKDILPIHLDRDNDLIVDDKDLCQNSLPHEMKNKYGCQDIIQDTVKIERYDGFLFDYYDAQLSDKTAKRIILLIKQLTPYGLNNIHYELLGNAIISTMDDETSLEFSKQRAMEVKEMLLNAGVYEENITINPQSNTSPIATDETDEGIRMNNRVDIIIKKLI